MGRVVLDKARTASYVPYTRGAQDVIETIFATQVTFAPWPAHVRRGEPEIGHGSGREQSSPSKPGLQKQRPCRHVPRPPQPFGHVCNEAHASPV